MVSSNAVIALVLIAGIAATVVQLVRAQRKLKRLKDEAREARRQIEDRRRDLEVGGKRAECEDRKRRKFGGEWE